MNQSKTHLISIIIPCYNSEKHIYDCLDSILIQDYRNWECLLINDGSMDKTLKILQDYASIETRFSVFSQENKGLSATRNVGIENAKGDYIIFIDSDDLLAENALQSFMKAIEPGNDILTGIITTVNGENLEKVSKLQHPKEGCILFRNEKQEVLIRTMESGLAPVAQNRLYRLSFIKKNNLRFKKGILHEDEYWFFETMYLAKNVKFINEETYLYRTDNYESITKNVTDRNLDSYLEILESIFDNYYIYNPDSYKKAIVKRYLQYLKKLIIDFCIREKDNLSIDYQQKLISRLKKVHTNPDDFNILSEMNENYYNTLNKLSHYPFDTIEQHFFRNPVNSIRKIYKLLIINFLK